MLNEIVLRRGSLSDLDGAARLLATVRRASFGFIPPSVHNDDVELAPYLGTRVGSGAALTLAESEGAMVGVMVHGGGWIEQLAISPAFQRRGIGKRLVHAALDASPTGVQLWTFASNTRARDFYEHLGFEQVAMTGGDNEEGQPDLCYRFMK